MEDNGIDYQNCNVSVKENSVFVTRVFARVPSGFLIRLLAGTDDSKISLFPQTKFTIHDETKFLHQDAGEIRGVTRCNVEHNMMVLARGSVTQFIHAGPAVLQREKTIRIQDGARLLMVMETTDAIKITGLNTIFISNPSISVSEFHVTNDTDEELRKLTINWSGAEEDTFERVYYERAVMADSMAPSDSTMHRPGLRFETSGVPPRSTKSFPFSKSEVKVELAYAMLIDASTRDKKDAPTDVFLNIKDAKDDFTLVPGKIRVLNSSELAAEGHIDRYYGKELVPCGKNRWVTQTISVQTQFDGRTAIGAKFQYSIKNMLPHPIQAMVIHKDNAIIIREFETFKGNYEIKF